MNLIDKRPFFLDGAMGANLFKAGMPRGVCPEEWMDQHPQIVLDILKSYIDAGSDAVYAPTFETTAPKLAKFGLEGRAREYNRMFVKLAKSVAGDKKVFGDVSLLFKKLGRLSKSASTTWRGAVFFLFICLSHII